jgi:phosphoenolpyruvate carboxykinase (ATP)
MKLVYTRAMVNAALRGDLDEVPYRPHAVFQVLVPEACPEVPAALLDARGRWADKGAYDRAAADLSARFRENFKKFGSAAAGIAAAGPR